MAAREVAREVRVRSRSRVRRGAYPLRPLALPGLEIAVAALPWAD